ncbi:MAG: alpha/beta hydrolase [Bacteroidetes bacterium]|nr:MAG: alpha/beta hydrolase [Bacteroidota bacterium]REK07561.1 MAG: alpha/beta hydrolase [Bacteroidota bacterium]REK37006.1 MAG: alpha/beta hydrolase [Bacteroidota bacterium]REK47827.1 MAG: alpha/beta hydrolase [Bacteroidota bacterium]
MRDNIILLHGALGSYRQLYQLQNLLESDFNVFGFDFIGHGHDSSNIPFSISNFSLQLEKFIHERNLSGCHIFGYSMGGYVALTLAAMRPGLIGHILTLGTKFNWNPEIAEKESRMLNSEKIQEKIPSFATRLMELHTGLGWKNVLSNTASMMIELGNNPPLNAAELSHVPNKVMICLGELDTMVSPEESLKAAEKLNLGTLHIIKDMEHPIEKADMKVLADLIRIHFR